MKILFFFLDGVGLGGSDPQINPFSRQNMPNLRDLLDGHQMLTGSHLPFTNDRATLLALDACLGVQGFPQSATGQATILTGDNIPAELGYHYGPKPNPPIRQILNNGNLFSKLINSGFKCTMLNAYPPRYFDSIDSGMRIYSAFPLAVTNSGIPLRKYDDLVAGNALSADLTAKGWHEHLKLMNAPLLNETEAGTLMGSLGMEYDFALFEYWLSDYVGHKQDMSQACQILESLDEVVGGLLEKWHGDEGLILLTSDHGNLEDMYTRRHTKNKVPALIIGNAKLRQEFVNLLHAASVSQEQLNLTCLAPAIINFLSES